MAHKLRYHPDNCTFIKLIFNKLLLLSTTYFPFSMPLASISAAAALFYSSNFSYKNFLPQFYDHNNKSEMKTTECDKMLFFSCSNHLLSHYIISNGSRSRAIFCSLSIHVLQSWRSARDELLIGEGDCYRSIEFMRSAGF